MHCTSIFRISLLALAASFGVGCAAQPASSDDSSTQDLSSNVMPAGYYELAASTGGRWLDNVNLHADGTFEASVGNSVSNLEGHAFNADGTYHVVTTAGHTTLTLAYQLNGKTTEDAYAVKKVGPSFMLEIVDAVGSSDFTMTAASKPATLTFAADGSVGQSDPIRRGGTVVIDYAVGRDKCPVAGDLTGSPVFLFGRMVGSNFGVERSFPEAPVNGHFRVIVVVGTTATELVLWFQNNAPSCLKWDSNGGANFHFPIVP